MWNEDRSIGLVVNGEIWLRFDDHRRPHESSLRSTGADVLRSAHILARERAKEAGITAVLPGDGSELTGNGICRNTGGARLTLSPCLSPGSLKGSRAKERQGHGNIECGLADSGHHSQPQKTEAPDAYPRNGDGQQHVGSVSLSP